MAVYCDPVKNPEAIVSTLLGILVVVGIAGAVIKHTSILKPSLNPQISATSTTRSPEEIIVLPSPTPVSGTYTVEPGDSLWKIAQKAYGSGYNWTDIYKSNKLLVGNNPSKLAIGIKLELPKMQARTEMAATQPVEHVVARGESLWKISVAVCGDGYSWRKIAQENGLSRPNLIIPGQKLKIGCR